jgi:GTP cyclohydrolase I
MTNEVKLTEAVGQEAISDIIRQRIIDDKARFYSNNNIAEYIQSEDELNALQKEIEGKLEDLLDSLVIDRANDHNTNDTPRRVAKMFLREVFGGRYTPKPNITAFPNANNYDELYITGPITVRSTCAHHLEPIVGKCWVGIFPGKNVIGLSKFNRLVDWVASRPQIQEEMTIQIADEIEKETQAEGIAVVVKAEHMCMTMRGVKEHDSDMTSSVMRGKMRDDPNLKQEFFHLLSGMKGYRE